MNEEAKLRLLSKEKLKRQAIYYCSVEGTKTLSQMQRNMTNCFKYSNSTYVLSVYDTHLTHPTTKKVFKNLHNFCDTYFIVTPVIKISI